MADIPANMIANLEIIEYVGIDTDYEVVGQNGDMMMVSVSGTAVRVE